MDDDDLDPYEFPSGQLEGDPWPPNWALVLMLIFLPLTLLGLFALQLYSYYDIWRYERWCEREARKHDR